ncbi:phosphoribosyltransferase [Streptomyces sp. G5(2025)]|uniref:phosphoribosyltransferase n=1 Tax=Streptomyces sp. G5(2025) TaxID=3406628 RepID=UPI003C27C41D
MSGPHFPDRNTLAPDDQRLVHDLERAYGTHFSHLVRFTTSELSELHAPGPLPPNVRVASDTEPAVAERMETITTVANLPHQRPADREHYFQALIDLYGMLPLRVADHTNRPGTEIVAPEREGRILAETLGCRSSDRYWTPQAKRVHVDQGLLVGVDDRLPHQARRMVLIDGVVATGVTLMAMLRLTVRAGAVVDVFTCHSTRQGALALTRCAERLGITLNLHIGHVSGTLNEKYYAVDPDAGDRLILGDVGDTISPRAAEPRTTSP